MSMSEGLEFLQLPASVMVRPGNLLGLQAGCEASSAFAGNRKAFLLRLLAKQKLFYWAEGA
jgi:hypothetical protein